MMFNIFFCGCRDLSSNYLHTITNSIFGGSSNVNDDLYLDDNNMTYLGKDVFNNVTIADLYLDNNLFKAVPPAVLSQSFDEL